MTSPGGRENEIKLPLRDRDGIAARLGELGFAVSRPRVFESNAVYDRSGADLRGSGRLLRLRTAGDQAVLTYKGAATPGRYKFREEIETEISDAPALAAILEGIGFTVMFRYEKYRTEYRGGAGVVTIDETPIGDYLELEGPPEWIDETARALGYHDGDYITASYGRLYLDYCRERNIPPGHMTFQDSSQPNPGRSGGRM